MKLELLRYSDNKESTLGLLFMDGIFQCYTLEDEFRNLKLAGETRIPAGEYQIIFREEESPMTKRYREDYDFFDWHLMLKNVPGFDFIYIHHGNHDDNTDGCILVGNTANNNQLIDGFIGNSRKAFERLYKKIWRELRSGEKVSIKIVDIDKGINIK